MQLCHILTSSGRIPFRWGLHDKGGGDKIAREGAANNLQTFSCKFEFAKKFNIQPLYVALASLACENKRRING